MNNKIQQIIEQLIPFVLLGVAIALIIGMFIMISYALIWGLVIGGIIWIGVAIKTLLFPSQSKNDKDSRIIEHKDID